jgi:hypothetical protein
MPDIFQYTTAMPVHKITYSMKNAQELKALSNGCCSTTNNV